MPGQDTLPADGKGYVGISVTALDADGTPIADGEPIYMQTSNGTLAETHQLSKRGVSNFYLYAPDSPGTTTVEASYGEKRASLTVNFTDTDIATLQGQISDAVSGEPLRDVQLQADTGLTATTDTEGHFFVTIEPTSKIPSKTTLHISKVGYYPDKRKIDIISNQATVAHTKLQPIAGGAFASTVIILDSRSDTPATEKLIETLRELLELAGAKVYSIHIPGQAPTTAERIRQINAIEGRGYYLQINHTQWRKDEPPLIAAHYRGNQGTETFLKRILEQFNKTLFQTPIVTVQDRTTPEIQQTNKMAMTLEIRSLNQQNASAVEEARAIFFGAWRFLKADGQIDAEEQKRFMAYLKGGQQ